MIAFYSSHSKDSLSLISPEGGLVSSFASGKQGFTLVEFIAVILLLSVLSLIIVSNSNNAGLEAEVSGATEVLKNHLRYAQTKAMNSDVSWGLNFSGSSYTLQDSTGLTAILPGDPSPAMTFAASSNPILFENRWGSPGSSTITVTVSKNGVSRTITVTKNTGFIP